MGMRYLLMVSFLLFSSDVYSDECLNWFKKAKLEHGSDCLMECVVTPVSMNSFHCTSRCDELCNSTVKEKYLFKLSDLYPGLTDEERALVAKEPQKMLLAYKMAWKAEELCLRLFPSSRTNDESDACRHFVWAALLYKEFGIELSTKILDAHEQDPKQPEIEKSMDVANNRLGQLSAELLIKNTKFNDSQVLESFEENLKKNRLIIISPRYNK